MSGGKIGEEIKASPLGAFSHRTFSVIWLATTLSLTGVAISDTASAWLMTNLNTDARLISLVQVATCAPMFLFTFLAGALADLVEPRRFLIVLETVISISILFFGFVVFEGWVTPNRLLLATFLLSTCWSLAAPAWLSITPLLVPDRELDSANAANSVGYNISRAIGPPLAGLALARFGPASPYWMFGLADLTSVAALLWWRPPVRPRARENPEHLWGSLRTGLQHAAGNRPLRATLMRTFGVYPFACGYLALLPLIARESVARGSEFYGALLATISIGAVLGSLCLGPLRKRLGPDAVVALGSGGIALALVLFGLAHGPGVALAASLIGGASWTIVLVGLYVSALLCLEDWVRGRGLAILLTAIFACLMVGSLVWGQVAAQRGLPTALFAAALGTLLMIPVTWRWKLRAA